MEQLHFYKYQGTGNVFVMIDNRDLRFPQQDKSLIQKICHRRFGIGGDGLILLQNHPEYDFEMIYYNADATSSMCGNGSRCAVHLAHHLGMISSACTFYAEDGLHQACIEKDGQVSIQMIDVTAIEEIEGGYFLNTGTRHYVRLVENLSNYDVTGVGKKVRYSDPFMPQGTNVSFVEIIDGQIHMRIYEKGVEDETWSSGTGVTAVALVLARHGFASPVRVHTRGGTLDVGFQQTDEGTFEDVLMRGPAVRVFEGTVFV